MRLIYTQTERGTLGINNTTSWNARGYSSHYCYSHCCRLWFAGNLLGYKVLLRSEGKTGSWPVHWLINAGDRIPVCTWLLPWHEPEPLTLDSSSSPSPPPKVRISTKAQDIRQCLGLFLGHFPSSSLPGASPASFRNSFSVNFSWLQISSSGSSSCNIWF